MSKSVIVGCDQLTCIVYLEDIIIFERLNYLPALREKHPGTTPTSGSHMSPQETFFGKTKLDYLSHTITNDEIRPQGHHVRAIQHATTKTGKDAWFFVGICNWLRKLIPNFPESITPSSTQSPPAMHSNGQRHHRSGLHSDQDRPEESLNTPSSHWR